MMAEFAYNNSAASATVMTPFYANYEWHLVVSDPRSVDVMHPASEVYAH